MVSTQEVGENGWTAVPVDAGQIFKDGPYINKPQLIPIEDIEFPSSDPIVSKSQHYVKERLPKQTYNHSLRVFYFGNFELSLFILNIYTD